MKAVVTTIFIITFSIGCHAQLSDFENTDQTLYGFNISLVTLKNPALLYEEGQKVGTYVAIGVDVTKYNFDQWGTRWGIDLKFLPDLQYKAYEFFKYGENAKDTARVDFSGIFWANYGLNVYSNKNVNIGLGGNFADYLMDIPDWSSTGNYDSVGNTLAVNWQEPSGWYWTAGPTVYIDGSVGPFVISLTGNYNFSFWRPVISNDYESRVNKIDGYEYPNFVFIDVTVNHNSGFYLSFDRTMAIDNGPNANKMSRSDLQIGWRF